MFVTDRALGVDTTPSTTERRKAHCDIQFICEFVVDVRWNLHILLITHSGNSMPAHSVQSDEKSKTNNSEPISTQHLPTH